MRMLNIRGLPVICLDTGNSTMKIDGFMVNQETLVVDYLTVKVNEDEDAGYSKKLFRYSDLAGIGDTAVTIQSESAIRTISSESLFAQVFSDQMELLGLRVISQISDELGNIVDFSFDPNSGKLLGIVVQDNSGYRAFKTQPYCYANEKCMVVNPNQEISAKELAEIDRIAVERSVDLGALVEERNARIAAENRRAEAVTMNTMRNLETMPESNVEPMYQPMKRAGNLYIGGRSQGQASMQGTAQMSTGQSYQAYEPEPVYAGTPAQQSAALSDEDMLAYMKNFL